MFSAPYDVLMFSVFYEESDEELQTLLSEYDSSLEAKDSEHYQLEQQATLKTADIAELQAEHSRLSTKLGQLQAEREAHERRLTERNALITEISHEQNYTGFERPPFSESTIESFIQKLQGDINDRTAGLDGLKLEIRDRENIFLSELQVMKTNVASVEETKKMLRKQMDATRQKQATCMRDMQNINVTQTEIDDLESRSMEESMALDQAKKQYNHLEIEQKIRKLNSELQKCEYELTKAGDEILVLNMQLETRAKLAVKKGEVERKEEAITKSLVVIQSEMTSLLGRTPDSPSMDRAVSEFCLQKQKDVKMLEDQWSTSQQALSSVDAKLSIARGNLKTKVEELEEKRNRIKAVADDKDYPDALAKAEKELIDGRDEVASMRSAGSMYSKFINRYNSSKCLAITEQRKDRLAQLRSVYDDLERLRDREVPAIEAKIEEYTLERTLKMPKHSKKKSQTTLVNNANWKF
ncbi:hypothetical protein DFS34DRAFT_494994 [Phlyctochytrium arcticum]|nr:hypothetical protein DFS34DRAFT_494994 [Phlyctochytrium arcticum]